MSDDGEDESPLADASATGKLIFEGATLMIRVLVKSAVPLISLWAIARMIWYLEREEVLLLLGDITDDDELKRLTHRLAMIAESDNADYRDLRGSDDDGDEPRPS